MTPDRWQKLEKIYLSAFELGAEQRATFLAEACGGDQELRNRVEAMLVSDPSDPNLPLNRSLANRFPPTGLQLAPGGRLGPYQIVCKLGEGGMGEVWKAVDTRLGRPVAIKVALDGFSSRFAQEGRAIAALNHPNICTLYDVGLDYLVMEYIEGVPLQGPLPAKQTIAVALQIAAALEAAHARGIVHRDLKPGNILMSSSGVKLLDFGLAKSSSEHDAAGSMNSTQTRPGTVLGTPAYMSPEQAAGGTADARSDIFSLGAVLYEALSGRHAFPGQTYAAVLAALLRDEPAPLDAPPDLERIVRRCLRKSPLERYPSAAALRQELETASAETQMRPSVAVLPFANLSGDKEQEYFGDGLAEEILNDLARVPGLKVIARTSAFAFRGQSMDIRRIAAELSVTHILEGSVRRSGDRIRVTAQLIAASDGGRIWSERYDRGMADVFVVQEEIAHQIGVALQARLAGDRDEPKRYTPELPVYDLFLKAMHHYAQFTSDSAQRAKELFEQTLACDPEFGLAHAMRAECFIELAVYSVLPTRKAASYARSAAYEALDRSPGLSEAHEVLGRVAALHDYDWVESERQFRIAMAAGPVTPRVRWKFAHCHLFSTGQLAACEAEIGRALQEDPVNALSRFTLALCLHAAGRLQDADAAFRQVLAVNPAFVAASYWLVRNLAAQGAFAEALSIAETLLSSAPRNPEVVGGLAGLLARMGDSGRAEQLMAHLGEDGSSIGHVSYHFLRGAPEAAAGAMAKAISERHFIVPLYIRTPLAQGLMDSAEWPAMEHTMRLPYSG